MPAVVIFNLEKIVVMGWGGITIYRDFYAFAATLCKGDKTKRIKVE